MKLFIFKQDRTNLWWACIITSGGGWGPASPFLSWNSALRAGLARLEKERRRQARGVRQGAPTWLGSFGV